MNSIPLTIYLFIFPQVTFQADYCQPCKSVEGSGDGKPNIYEMPKICQVPIKMFSSNQNQNLILKEITLTFQEKTFF